MLAFSTDTRILAACLGRFLGKEKVMQLNLTFVTTPPEECVDYLVRGRLQAPNGYDGLYFLAMSFYDGQWRVGPDCLPMDTILSMWDGSSGTCAAPFTPVSWARLPGPVEGPVL
jgi:hypothetical protein